MVFDYAVVEFVKDKSVGVAHGTWIESTEEVLLKFNKKLLIMIASSSEQKYLAF